MPQFDLLGMQVAEYTESNGHVTYGQPMSAGDAMRCNLELSFAEGRLYAEGALAEFLREAVGGTVSIGVKYIPAAAQKLMYGMDEKNRSLDYTPKGSETQVTKTATSLRTTAVSTGHYVGFACFAPDMIDKAKKYTCFFIPCALFGPPSYALETKGQSIRFATPTTTGEFLRDGSAEGVIQEIYIADDENEARAWCAAVFA